MKRFFILFSTLFATSIISCTPAANNQMEKQKQITEQLTKLDSLLRDSSFAIDIAKTQEVAYYTSQKQDVAVFPGKDSMQQKSFKEEKIAINLAGFYAVECGINALIEEKGETPLYWLRKIVDNGLDSMDVLLLNRFANATWKAGQPFRSLSRITRSNFISANFLDAAETKKDYVQVIAAASKLLDSIKLVDTTSKVAQLKKISELLKDKKFALEMAMHMESSYYAGENKPAPTFVTGKEDTAMINKPVFDEKVAINIAGFYALECGLSYMATSQNKIPSDVLKSIIDGSIDIKDKRLLERFANATWKAGQPFRSLDRITRNIFVPFSFLPEDEIEKDWVQIKSAAEKVLERF